MSAQIHQLHSEASAVPSTASHTPPGPTKAEQRVITKFLKLFVKRGFCKITDASVKETRLFNRLDGKPQSMSYLRENFEEWLDETGQECGFWSERYFIRRLKHIVGRVFKPGASDFIEDPVTGYRYANTYRRYEPTTESAEVARCFHAFFERMFPNERERHIVLQWLAHIFQRPWERPSWHIMLLSEPGTGKGFLVQGILRPLLHHTCIVASYSRITGKHSTVLTDNLVTLLDDCKSRNEATQTELKSLLSEERTLVERKYASAEMEDTYARMILASNEEIPLYLEASERRWFIPANVVHLEDRHKTQAEIIQPLADWLKQPESLCKVYNWFMGYPLDGFNYKDVPDSDGLIRLVEKSKSPHAEFLECYVQENKVFTYAELKEALKADGYTPPSDAALQHRLDDVGYEKTKTRLDAKARPWLWHPKGWDADQIKAAYADSQSDPSNPY